MNILEVENLSINFGGLLALDGVSFTMEKGQIYSLIGPNGAGKTTVFNCITRIYKPKQGAIQFEGQDVLKMAPHQVAESGIARTFQNIELFSNLTTMDNLLLAHHRLRKSNLLTEMMFLPSVREQEIAWRRRVEEIIDFLDLHPFRERKVNDLPYGTRKKVEMGRALALEPRLLLLDEPSSGMNPEEREDLRTTLKDIQAYLKIGILMVEHDMNLVMDISDRICALNYGRVIVEGLPQQIQVNREVIEAYLGEENGLPA